MEPPNHLKLFRDHAMFTKILNFKLGSSKASGGESGGPAS